MILVLIVNPSIDRLTRLDAELKRGGVFRLPMAGDMADGEGTNVFKALRYAKGKTPTPYPTSNSGRFTHLLEVPGIPYEAINMTNKARVNLTSVKPDGTTIKPNSPGMTLTKTHRRRVLEGLIHYAKHAT